MDMLHTPDPTRPTALVKTSVAPRGTGIGALLEAMISMAVPA